MPWACPRNAFAHPVKLMRTPRGCPGTLFAQPGADPEHVRKPWVAVGTRSGTRLQTREHLA
eukprot:8465975-Lingulodinium_polyedra.AAC.1